MVQFKFKRLHSLIFIAFAISSGISSVNAQVLEPRSYSNIAVSMNFLLAAYGYNYSGVLYDTSIPLENANIKIHGSSLAAFMQIGVDDVLRNDRPLSHWKGVKNGYILDVREPVELAVENIQGAVNILLGQFHVRLVELPKNKEIQVICLSDQRAYMAVKLLLQHGFNSKSVSDGMLSKAQNFMLEYRSIE